MRLKGILEPYAAIQSLPPELLVIIFTLAHRQSYDVINNSWHENADLRSPSTFPYALASVCKLWQDVMSTVPEFWTRITVFIDSNSFSFSNLPLHIEWSRDLLFQIIVTRRLCSDVMDIGEKARVRQVMDTLGPHLHRCFLLHFDVKYSSSLPSIYADIFHDRVCPDLRSIVFKSRVGDGPGNYFRDDLRNDTLREENPLPALRSLVLDGFNYVDLCEHHPDWFLSMPEDGLEELSVSHFTQSQRSVKHKYSFYDGWNYLKDVAHLKLSSLDFSCESKDINMDDLVFSKLHVLILEDLSWQLVREILLCCEYINGVSVTRCAIGEISDVALSAFTLILDSIPASSNFSQFLAQWSGFDLTIRDCPGLDDSVFEKWSTKYSDAPDTLYCPLLGNLTIHNCPNFSVERLKHLVEVRLEQCNRSGGLEFGDPPLSYLKVTGHGPFLSDEDRKWFLNNVESFDGWETHQTCFTNMTDSSTVSGFTLVLYFTYNDRDMS